LGGPNTIAVVYSKNVNGMNLLNHNGLDVRTLLRKRIFARPAATPGAQESLGDRIAGIAMCRTPIRPQRCRGSDKM
jgi:hypothetical protein